MIAFSFFFFLFRFFFAFLEHTIELDVLKWIDTGETLQTACLVSIKQYVRINLSSFTTKKLTTK